MSPSPEFSVPRSRQLDVALARGPGFLLKRMQHVDGFSEASYVDHAIRAGVIPHSEFLNSFPNRRHRFEIGRLLAVLDLLQLAPRIMPCIFRKLSEALQRVPRKAQRFHEWIIHNWIYCDKPKKMRSSDRLKGTELVSCGKHCPLDCEGERGANVGYQRWVERLASTKPTFG